MLRRNLFAISIVLPLAACAGTTTTGDSKVAGYITAIVSGLKAILARFPLAGSTLARYNTLIDKLATLAQKVASGAESGSSAITQALSATEEALSLFGDKLPASVQPYLAAIETVLAILEGLSGLLASRASRHVARMTEAQAMAILR